MTTLVLVPITEDLGIVSHSYIVMTRCHMMPSVTSPRKQPGHPAPWMYWRVLWMEDCNMRGSIWTTIILIVNRASPSGKVSYAFKLNCVTTILKNKKI